MSYAVLVTVTDGTVAHYFAHLSDAQHYLAECQEQGYSAVISTQ